MRRLRAGDYRVVYHVEDARLAVALVRVAHRRTRPALLPRDTSTRQPQGVPSPAERPVTALVVHE
ncbi:type II toxin-antitoxin system RelE/ParE family toxin, partial [Frankia sp. Cj5]|uniref:type II toxin-antitoxin system RelE family toxin n=2 Tax=Frankia TaxID=1854 RepID=UPI001EF6E96F